MEKKETQITQKQFFQNLGSVLLRHSYETAKHRNFNTLKVLTMMHKRDVVFAWKTAYHFNQITELCFPTGL